MSEDIQFLKDQDNWVQWPVCPVKRYKGHSWPDCGIVVVGGGHTVYEKNMFELVTGPIMDQVQGCPKHEYPSFEAMIADGWVVD